MDFHSQLQKLKEENFFSSLGIERGIEKESLRVTKDGFISEKAHPSSLGASFTNPSITTDFAESLVEMVTPVFTDVDELYEYLLGLHVFIANSLEDDELLWPFSMPPKIIDSSKINIATYSDTNMGKLKHIYRKGLALRYGKTMQCVSGIHYNFSLSDSSLSKIAKSNDQGDINNAYLGLIRNFKRLFWFVLSEFGHSSVVDKSFVSGRDNDLDLLNSSDLFKEGSTSLRMSDIGYQSKAQKNLDIKYNDLDEFLEELRLAISEPYPEFDAIGLKDSDGNFQQISNGILQIENELYDCIRPKRAGLSGQRPYELLKKEGIKYVEIRGIDLDPDDVAGISKDKILLLDLILLYCFIRPSPMMDDKEKSIIENNDTTTIKYGRLLETTIILNNKKTGIFEAHRDIVKDLMSLAEAMDDTRYVDVVLDIKDRVNTFNADKPFHDLGLEKAQQNSNILRSHKNIETKSFKEEAEISLLKFDKIQKEASLDNIDEFMNSYNSQL